MNNHPHGARQLFSIVTLCSLMLAGGFPGAAASAVKVLSAPARCLVPEVAMDAQGILHLVYGLDHHACYVRSTDQGATFTKPVQIDSSGQVETRMGERGPKLAVGGDGVIHVVWVDEWAPGVKTFVRYARSLDGGKSFEPLKTLSSMSGVDGATLAADGRGHVTAFWHVMAEPKPEVKSATWLHTARSSDRGAAFGPCEQVVITNLPGLACSMCMMRARADADGNVCLAFRGARDSIRDIYVLKGPIAENRFTALRVNQDHWNIDYCPMCGPELTFTPDGRLLCAFMSRQRVYWAISDPALTSFRLHVATPASQENEIYPSAHASRHGEVLFLWQVGPMAVKGSATVRWMRYTLDGRPVGESGTVGRSFAGTKSTAFVDTNGDFQIVTTATQEN